MHYFPPQNVSSRSRPRDGDKTEGVSLPVAQAILPVPQVTSGGASDARLDRDIVLCLCFEPLPLYRWPPAGAFDFSLVALASSRRA
jgi:hypothetical protein